MAPGQSSKNEDDSLAKLAHPVPNTSTADFLSSNNPFGGFLRFDNLQHVLKLRSTIDVSDRLTAQVGADYNISSKVAMPVAALSYRVGKDGTELCTLKANTKRLVVQKSFDIRFDPVSCRVHALAGINYIGKPELGIDLDRIQPASMVVAAACVLLALRKPVSGSKSFGNVTFRLPQFGDEGTTKGEVHAGVSRKGRGLELAVRQINAVLRF